MAPYFRFIDPKTVRCILISRLRFMGDVILTTPLIRALKKGMPHTKLIYLTEPPYADLLRHNPYLDGVLSFDREKFNALPVLKSFWQQKKLVSKLRLLKCGAAVDLLGLPRTAFLMVLSGASVRIGGDYRYRKHLYTHLFPAGRRYWKTAIDFHLNVLKFFNLPDDGKKTDFFLTGEEIIRAKTYLKKNGFDPGRPIVGLHPGGTWPAKLWDWERFAELALRLRKETKVQIFLTGGPNDISIVEKVQAKTGNAAFWGGVLSLRRLAGVMSHFSVFISNDCGPMHLAPAVGTPTIGIFGPGEPDIWFPYSKKDGHTFVCKSVFCSPCGRDFCPTDHICMKEITVEEIFKKAVARI